MNPENLPLRDIHLPDPVSWWPPAPGWWILTIAFFGLIGAFAWWRSRQRRLRNSPITLARIELDRLRAAWVEQRDAQQLVKDLSIWLRRTGMSLSSRHQAASLTGADWHRCLDDIAGETVFDAESDRLITESPYRNIDAGSESVDGEKLLVLCDRWLDAVRRRKRQA
jgi:hypothetical protein